MPTIPKKTPKGNREISTPAAPDQPPFLPPDTPGLVSVLATVDLKTGKITAPALEQILALPAHGPALKAAIHALALGEYAWNISMSPPANAVALCEWFAHNMRDIFWRLLNSTPHVYRPDVDPQEPELYPNGRRNRWGDIRPDIEKILDSAVDKIEKLLEKGRRAEAVGRIEQAALEEAGAAHGAE
jgi:hypothetical protein